MISGEMMDDAPTEDGRKVGEEMRGAADQYQLIARVTEYFHSRTADTHGFSSSS